ncbi:MAG: GNAT family N-acetyltransferase [Flaviflexus sp.]|nr:GNAT family N-acetyltransferase [Flaviflexus sp.]
MDLSRLGPGHRSDLEIAWRSGATINDRGDYLILATPDAPTYHWGNVIYVTGGDVNDAERWKAVFERSFPHATWISIGLPEAPDPAPYEAAGMEVSAEDELTSSELTGDPGAHPDYEFRPLRQADWEGWIDMQVAGSSEEDRAGESRDDYATFLADKAALNRRLIEAGDLQYFGAFADSGIAASLGIARLGELARYQSVFTAPEHRRRGLASHLLHVAAAWAGQRGASTFVIVAEADSDAGRIYRRSGFTLASHQHIAELA